MLARPVGVISAGWIRLSSRRCYTRLQRLKVNAIPDLIGVGIYSISEAARLAEVEPRRVRGWVQGYPNRMPAGTMATAAHRR
jgi:hypothetical protein